MNFVDKEMIHNVKYEISVVVILILSLTACHDIHVICIPDGTLYYRNKI